MAAPNQETELAAALRPWTDRAAGLTARRIEDARQHAAAGSLPTAASRLAELSWSLKRHVSDARSNFYHQSFGQHARAGLNPELHQVGLGPDPDGDQAARTARILDRDYSVDIQDLVDDAQAGLESAAQAGGGDYLLSWALEHGERITARANMELSNSQIAIFQAIGQIFVKPEFR